MSEVSVKQKAALWVVVVFLLGVTLGGVFGYLFAKEVRGDLRGDMHFAARRAQKIEQSTKDLDLTTDQQKKLDAIVTETQGRFKAIHESMRPQIDEARGIARNKIRAILTPQQLPKFEEHIRRMDEERKKWTQP